MAYTIYNLLLRACSSYLCVCFSTWRGEAASDLLRSPTYFDCGLIDACSEDGSIAILRLYKNIDFVEEGMYKCALRVYPRLCS